jgi:hypothetical protein
MARVNFTPAAAAPITPGFNRWQFGYDPDFIDRLAFDPRKIGSQFYPTITREEKGNLLLLAAGQVLRGMKGIDASGREGLTHLAVTIDAGHRVGFDAYFPGPNPEDTSDMAAALPLSPAHETGLTPRIVRITTLEERDDTDPLVLMAAARHVRFYLKVDRSEEIPKLYFIDAEVTANKDPFFATNLNPAPQQPTVLMLTPAQRSLIGAMEVGPKVKFKEVTLPKTHEAGNHSPKAIEALKSLTPALRMGSGKR